MPQNLSHAAAAAAGNTAPTLATAPTHCPHTYYPPNPYHTCRHPYHDGYSNTNLPPLLFRMDAPGATRGQPPIQPLRENDTIVHDASGDAIRDFPFLPRYISVRPPGWLLEFWIRTDSRLTYRDIKARMTGPGSIPSDNTLNMRREREARTPLGLSCWTTRRGYTTRVEIERIERWTTNQVRHNTTMDIIYNSSGVPHRLRKKGLLAPGVATTTDHTYSLDFFLDGRASHTPSSRLASALDLFHELESAAIAENVANWRDLPAQYFPAAWASRRNTGSTATAPAGNTTGSANISTGPQTMPLPNNHHTPGNGGTGPSGNAMHHPTPSNGFTPATNPSPFVSQPHYQHGFHAESGPAVGGHRSQDEGHENFNSFTPVGGPGGFNYRFNGGGIYSIRRNPIHSINTDSGRIMARGNPFSTLQRGGVRSFERFLLEDEE
ncbi:hypothetical protein AJ80_02494 [Polytolypa hystricis UAMH7299]|uniref:Uncharacterized protein n=1 Tax=Polytolypa hystricis (strain UAMH7299) TaxID=1447883 RepID=A0A2B7YH26_POLH7|nr:hypothetical protein AJ80_02494 [Polytolypa hystricis UAMH7299]